MIDDCIELASDPLLAPLLAILVLALIVVGGAFGLAWRNTNPN